MGLLTNPQTRQKVASVIARYNNKLCFLCYTAGLAWFIALAYAPLNARTYFSENALLPGLVEADFYHDHGATDLLRDLKEEVKMITESSPQNSDAGFRLPSVWLEQKFRSLGLDAYTQNYTFRYPSEILRGRKFQGQNVYGILRAPRSAGTEAVVMTVPYRPPENSLDRTAAGIAMMFGMAKAFRKQTHWAKDIIFLVTEHEQIGMQAWLEAYHYTLNEYIFPGELHGRSGSLQAAINLELGTESIHRLNIKLEGLNGQLPNLDLINTVVRLCKREGVPVTLQKRLDTRHIAPYESFEDSLKTMLLMMWNQAPGLPTGNHGLFHRYHIEAITLQGVRMKNAKKAFSFIEIGRVLEGVFRSLNNLLERFHQSFFFYLLPATERYISIGLYMPPFGILAAPIVVKALALWISSGIKQAEQESREEEEKKEEETNEEDDGGDSESTVDTAEEGELPKLKHGKPSLSVLSVLPNTLMAIVFGLGAYWAPGFFIRSSHSFHMPESEGLALGAVAVQLSALFYPKILTGKSLKHGDVGPSWEVQKCVSLLVLGVLLSGISLMNISLAFFLAVVWVPVMVLIRPTASIAGNLMQYLLLLLVSPISLLMVGSLVSQLVTAKYTSVLDLLTNTWSGSQQALLLSYVDGEMFGNWLFHLTSCCLLPCWLLFWSLLWTKPY